MRLQASLIARQAQAAPEPERTMPRGRTARRAAPDDPPEDANPPVGPANVPTLEPTAPKGRQWRNALGKFKVSQFRLAESLELKDMFQVVDRSSSGEISADLGSRIWRL